MGSGINFCVRGCTHKNSNQDKNLSRKDRDLANKRYSDYINMNRTQSTSHFSQSFQNHETSFTYRQSKP